ncbi:MAG: HAD family hydrolase [Bacteroidales bacterium]|nr:HAD family hydrolase [Bacteroidales bacterium]
MKKKAIILDLDNTIYLVSSIGEKLFKTLFQLITESGDYKGDFNQLRVEIMRTPFQKVADAYRFGASLKAAGIKLLENISYDDEMETVESFNYIRGLPCKKFLVTTGFTKMQNSKIKKLDLEKDFENIFVIDPSRTTLAKKDIFEKIIADYGFKTEDVLVVGDDINSEIKAAQELGIETVVYDFNLEHTENKVLTIITDFRELERYL